MNSSNFNSKGPSQRMKSSPSKQNILTRKSGVTSKQKPGVNITQIKNEKLALMSEVLGEAKQNRSCQKGREEQQSLKIPLSPVQYSHNLSNPQIIQSQNN